jgi:hypothetical protein
MLEIARSLTRNLRAAVGRHAVAAGLSLALAAAVAGVGAGFAIAASAGASLPTAAVTAATTSASATGNPSTGAAARPIIRGLIALTARDTGQTLAQVRTLLRQDETLNQIAGGQAATVVQAAEAAVTSKVNAEVAASKLTSAQAATLTTRVDNRIHQVMAAPGRHVLLALRGGASSSPQASPAASPSPSPAS